MTLPITHYVKTKLGHEIGVKIFKPITPIDKSIIISSATGVLQRYYSKFANHFSSLGYTVYTFDYYGIGESKRKPLKEIDTDLKSWGENDQAAVVDYAKLKHPYDKLILVTHSIGGQILSFNKSLDKVDAIVTVASQSGYWKHWKGFERFKLYVFWNALIPVFTPIFGYFPAKKLGLFESLPKNMVKQWSAWGKKPDYILSELKHENTMFAVYDKPMLILSVPKDEYASKSAVDWLAQQFINAKIDRRHLVPEELGIPNIGHFGFFREAFKPSLWKMTEEWIENHS
ncbi:MAG: alpha/beta fold hydrolase [Winogradskyella sp.]|uniref:alpha/beta hydrolase family protein n=1 Tax=Winogradskyella sp. TaxID=1883156 RepID=UPI0025D66286|nr:alpha/beta fold hydrolase [Winogradskyella sp.]NRB58458.1 alpha/beta fold hydrolase [Winogradskyella sp.]